MNKQTEVLLNHLKEHGNVTQMEAYEEYGIFRLASRIHELRVAGIPIEREMKKGENRYGVECRYAEYRLGAEA